MPRLISFRSRFIIHKTGSSLHLLLTLVGRGPHSYGLIILATSKTWKTDMNLGLQTRSTLIPINIPRIPSRYSTSSATLSIYATTHSILTLPRCRWTRPLQDGRSKTLQLMFPTLLRQLHNTMESETRGGPRTRLLNSWDCSRLLVFRPIGSLPNQTRAYVTMRHARCFRGIYGTTTSQRKTLH